MTSLKRIKLLLKLYANIQHAEQVETLTIDLSIWG